MATFTITIPDAAVPDILDALADKYGWNSTATITKANFAKQQLGVWLTGAYVEYKAKVAAQAASASAASTAATVVNQITVT